MTDNTYGYGRAGGPAIQNVREFMDIQVSAVTTTAQQTFFKTLAQLLVMLLHITSFGVIL